MNILIQGALLRAITDNMVHGTLAVIIWLLGYMSHVDCRQSDVKSRHLGNGLAKHTVVILQSVACGVLSSAVDIDHFLAAGSFDLQVRIFNYSKTKVVNKIKFILQKYCIFMFFLPYLPTLLCLVQCK